MQIKTYARRMIAAALFLVPAIGALHAQGAGRRVALTFRPMVGATPFACGTTYTDVGTGHTSITPSDFAMYVHDVRLVTSDGREVPVALDQDNVYQSGTVTLLDFEDGTGPCSNGSKETHLAVTGTVPDGRYTGVRFVIGLPFERNHLELASQPSPLSITRMFWAWNSGHKFLRFDTKTTAGLSYVLHLGSTGCTPTGSPSTVPTACAQANRVAVAIDRFDPDKDVIVADAAQLFSGNNLEVKGGCMSSPRSADCAPMFAALGLPFNGSAPGPQKFLKAAPAKSARADQ